MTPHGRTRYVVGRRPTWGLSRCVLLLTGARPGDALSTNAGASQADVSTTTVSASGGTTPWRAFQPEPEAGDLPVPRRGAGGSPEPRNMSRLAHPLGTPRAVAFRPAASLSPPTAERRPPGVCREGAPDGSCSVAPATHPRLVVGNGRSPASGSGWKARQGVVPPLAETSFGRHLREN